MTATSGLATSTDPVPAPPGIVSLDPASRRLKRLSALTTMGLPIAGSIVGAVLVATRRFTVLDGALLVAMYAVHMGGITIGFHRHAAHKAFRTSLPLQAALLAAGSMGAQGPLTFWVATHRRHHRFSDRPGDPHSPNLHGTTVRGRLRGLWYAHMPWMLSDESARWTVFAPDVIRDRQMMWFNRTYFWWVGLGLLLPASIGLAVGRSWGAALGGLVFGGFVRILLANQAAWCVGSVCHAVGGRPFENGDRSANNWAVALVTFGEGLQNNHHAFPGSFRHAVRWWEPDMSGWVVAGLAAVGLVWDARQPDRAAVAARRSRHQGPSGPTSVPVAPGDSGG